MAQKKFETKRDEERAFVHDVIRDARSEAFSEMGSNILGDVVTIATDVAAAGVTSVFAPITAYRAWRWSNKGTDKPLRSPLSWTNPNSPEKLRKKASIGARRRFVGQAEMVVGGVGIGAFRAGIAALHPEFGKRGPIVGFMDSLLAQSPQLENFYHMHDPAVINTLLITGLFMLTQGTNIWLQTAKFRNYARRYEKAVGI